MTIEDRLRRWSTTASEPLPLITEGSVVVNVDGSVVVNVLEFDGPRPDDLRRLADLVAAVRSVKRDWDGVVIVDALDCDLLEAMFAALAALDEASRG